MTRSGGTKNGENNEEAKASEVASSSSTVINNYTTTQSMFECEKFNAGTMIWDRWIQRIEGAFETFSVPTDKRTHYLVHNVELDTFNLLADKVSPKSPYSLKYEDAKKLLSDHFSPAPLEIAEIFKFNHRVQKENESVRDFVASLQKLSIHCNFGDYQKKALRNQLVCGLRDVSTQNRLLEISDLTFDKALEIATSRETCAQGSAALHSDAKKPIPDAEVNALHTDKNKKRHVKKFNGKKKPDNDSTSSKKCHRCAKTGHSPDKCYHIKAVCKVCQKIGHIDQACFKKNKNKAHTSVLEAVEEFADMYVNECKSSSGLRRKIWVHPTINGVELKMELDCAAAVSTINYREALKYWPKAEVKTSQLTLLSFNGQPSKVHGEIMVRVNFEKCTKELKLFLVKEERPPLFGLEWIYVFKVDWNKYIPYVGEISVCAPNSPPPEVLELLRRFEVPSKSGIGKISDLEARVQLKEDARPVFFKARPVPFALQSKIDAVIDKYISEGIYIPVTASDWATPIVPVVKASGDVRICGDYKITVNPQIIIDAYPMPTYEEMFADMQGDEYTKIDIYHAYMQLMMNKKDQKILTLNTHRGLLQPTRMMFGLASAACTWQATMEKILAGIRRKKIFQDDLYMTGPTREEHLQTLREVLERLQKYNLRINVEKSVFFAKSIEYCGYRVDKEGIHPLQAKCEAIVNMKRPENKKDIEVFRGLVNYYSRFVPEFSNIMYPLNRLSRQDVEFEWSSDCEAAFVKIKQILSSERVLVHFNPALDLIVATDASPFAVAAILSHRFADGSERPIQYASQSLNQTQQKYAHIDKEAYAIVYGIKKFHQYIYGRKFTLITDCEPLTKIFSPDKGLPVHSAMRMQHYAIFLQSYTYQIKYRRTNAHANVDALSRLPSSLETASTQEPDVVQMNVLEEIPVTSSIIAKETATEPKLKKLMEALEKGHDLKPVDRFNINILEFSLQRGCIFRGSRIVIPTSLKEQMLKKLHSVHFGISKMKSLARSICWWPGISNDLEDLAKKCAECKLFANNPAKVNGQTWKSSEQPFERVHVDFAGPFLSLKYFVLVDSFSKWPEISVVKNEDAATVIRECTEIFSRFGYPSIIVSDNGTAFTSAEFQNFLKEKGIEHRTTAPFHPATNGQVERYNATFKKALKTLNASPQDVNEKLKQFLMLYRRTPHTTTNKSPAELLLGRQIRAQVDIVFPPKKPEAERAKKVDDEKVRKLSMGDNVIARDYSSPKTKWQFGTVSEKLGKLHYNVLLDDGRTWKRHIDQLRIRSPDQTSNTTPKTVGKKPDQVTNPRPKRVIKRPVRLNL
ncbi:uncharacterized protein K02A2.6-like [Planococcus citri]|uniref:uncharacterized protein K02A2.6-like n=1 Tax=Planococcus citri TaxID=170843 RepID=UPI0031F7A867